MPVQWYTTKRSRLAHVPRMAVNYGGEIVGGWQCRGDAGFVIVPAADQEKCKKCVALLKRLNIEEGFCTHRMIQRSLCCDHFE